MEAHQNETLIVEYSGDDAVAFITSLTGNHASLWPYFSSGAVTTKKRSAPKATDPAVKDFNAFLAKTATWLATKAHS